MGEITGSGSLAAAPENMGGFRVVRKLAIGSRADILVGVGRAGSVALKVFHSHVSSQEIGRELAALSRAESPHFVRLLDVASGDDERPILIFDRLRWGSVAALLRDRDSLEGGEVVTILAPLAGELETLHRHGVGHGGIAASQVHFGDLGEPVLLGFGHAEIFAADGSMAAIDAEPAAQRDRDQLAALTVALLARVRNSAMDERVVSLLRWIDESPRMFEFAGELESRLFDCADPIPVRFGGDSQRSASVPARVVATHPQSRTAGPPLAESGAGASGGPGAGRAQAFIGRLDTMLRENPVDSVRTRLIGLIRGVRKPFWFIGAGVAVALIVAVGVLPQGAPAARALPHRSKALPATPLPSQTPLPDDPLAALGILLSNRSRCISARSVLCLDGVDDQASSAWSQDAALIQQLQEGSERPTSADMTVAGPSLVETLGDTVLVRPGPHSNPASVLMIRTEAGWRIRGYLSGVPSTGSPSAGG